MAKSLFTTCSHDSAWTEQPMSPVLVSLLYVTLVCPNCGRMDAQDLKEVVGVFSAPKGTFFSQHPLANLPDTLNQQWVMAQLPTVLDDIVGFYSTVPGLTDEPWWGDDPRADQSLYVVQWLVMALHRPCSPGDFCWLAWGDDCPEPPGV